MLPRPAASHPSPVPWGMKRGGRKVPRNRLTNWGFKLANQLMQEIEEGEPIDLDDCCPAAVERVAADARRVRVSGM
jgi:hypothetical protein